MALDITLRDLAPVLGALDIRFAELMTALDGHTPADVLFPAAALTSWASRRGHVCFDLQRGEALLTEEGYPVTLPSAAQSPDQWPGTLSKSSVVGRPGEFKPMIMDNQARLYLHQYWFYENELAGFIVQRYQMPVPLDKDLLADGIKRLFPSVGAGINMQAVAAVSALTHGFCAVSGGPGTGKTTTVAGILALMAEQAAARMEERPLEIVLTAPTGKAAARLGDAVSTARHSLDSPASNLAILPGHAATIHRLLGSMPDSARFRYNRQNKLTADVVVVDEASMVDLRLMTHLVAALHDRCRLILVGDMDQLSSVAAGSIFADICKAGGINKFSRRFQAILSDVGVTGDLPGQSEPSEAGQPADAVIGLDRNFRFAEDSGISRLSRAVRNGDFQEAMAVLSDDKITDVRWHHGRGTVALPILAERIVPWVSSYMAEENERAACFDRFDAFRVLCALREGPNGAFTLNRQIEHMVRQHLGVAAGREWYPGRPVVIVRNDYQRWLFNGDVGLTLYGPDNVLQVYFQGVDGLRGFYPHRLPDHETAFAMTIHKSQGSEFDTAFVVMPDSVAPVLSRPLLYTAITRAKSLVEIVGETDILKTTMDRKVLRTSGLSEAIGKQRGIAGERLAKISE
ncbi:MAG: exodeoxyribonuclease V subunit alpha [Thermodesulfobacteriota bacterium]|nr:exodeoxyribonuclease V subunit alpha [Thermodesulfobacteriota bacterium]